MARDNPFDDDRDDDYEDIFEDLFRLIEEIMGEGMGPNRRQSQRQDSRVDKRETEDSFIFVVDVPGYQDDQLSTSFHGDRVKIEGERVQDGRRQSVTESVPVPRHANEEDVDISVNNGIVEIVVPKDGRSSVGFQ